MEWLIADTHFGHENIIKYENRPFKNADEMDKKLIHNWNKKVKEDDIVYHLGDFALTNTEKQFEIFNQLNGKKYLIIGNHDQQSRTKLLDRMGFEDAFDKYEYDKNIIFTHRPIEVENNQINIHGHIHGLFYENSKWKDNNHFCVSVELINYEPISVETVMALILFNKF
ncbi:MAG: metallophosphoesterase [Bacillota bacterium]